jgi:hypothetical protein
VTLDGDTLAPDAVAEMVLERALLEQEPHRR